MAKSIFEIIPKCFAFDGHPHERLFDEKYVCVAWKENDQIGDLLTLEQYQNLQHVIRYSRGALQTTFDQQFLDQAGFRAMSRLSSPPSPWHREPSSERSALPRCMRVLRNSTARSLPIRILAPPIAFPMLTEVLEWHYRGRRSGLGV